MYTYNKQIISFQFLVVLPLKGLCPEGLVISSFPLVQTTTSGSNLYFPSFVNESAVIFLIQVSLFVL